jgi:hypothetical protein
VSTWKSFQLFPIVLNSCQQLPTFSKSAVTDQVPLPRMMCPTACAQCQQTLAPRPPHTKIQPPAIRTGHFHSCGCQRQIRDSNTTGAGAVRCRPVLSWAPRGTDRCRSRCQIPALWEPLNSLPEETTWWITVNLKRNSHSKHSKHSKPRSFVTFVLILGVMFP